MEEVTPCSGGNTTVNANRNRYFTKEKTISFINYMNMLVALMLCLLPFAASATSIAGRLISLEEAEQEIAQALMEAGAGENIRAEVVGYPAGQLVHDNPEQAAEIKLVKWDGRAKWFEASLVTANTHKRLSGRYDRVVELPVVSKRLRAGETVMANDIRYKEVPVSRVPRHVIRDERDLIGKTAKASLMPGRPIEARQITRPYVVTRNDKVHMVFQSPTIQIRTQGQALEDGAEGDRIRVRNSESGKLVMGVVQANGSVEISSLSLGDM